MLTIQSLHPGAHGFMNVLHVECRVYEKNVGKGRVTVKTSPAVTGNAFILSATVGVALV